MTIRQDYETLALEVIDQHVLLVTYNRPEVRNARNTLMGIEQLDLMRSLYVDSGDLRCVVLTGAGDKAFSAGGDLKERKTMTEAVNTTQRRSPYLNKGYRPCGTAHCQLSQQ